MFVCFSRGYKMDVNIFEKRVWEKSYQNCICHPGVKVWSQNFWERGVRKKILSKKCLFVFLGVKLWSEKNICHVKEIPKGCENLNICSSGGLKSDVRMFEKKGVKN